MRIKHAKKSFLRVFNILDDVVTTEKKILQLRPLMRRFQDTSFKTTTRFFWSLIDPRLIGRLAALEDEIMRKYFRVVRWL
jgi:hypothetical protein